MKSYSYQNADGLIDIFTLSPNKEYYYRVQKPVSINMSNFACKIAFYNSDDQLLYFRNNTFAHWLKPWQTINLVIWSKQGNMAYFYEYARNNVYESVFLNLKERYCYRIDELQNNFVIINGLQLKDREYDEDDVVRELQNAGINQYPLIKDELPASSFLDRLFSKNKWYPSWRIQ